jgi:excinuclease ABC subunit C
LSDEKIAGNKFKPCLEYHVGNCLAPCISKQSVENYEENIVVIKKILKGNLNDIIKYLKDLMNVYATELDYENASLIKGKIEAISNFHSKSTIVNSNINNVDVFSIINNVDDVCVNFLRVANGAIIQVHSIILRRALNEPLNEILSTAITDIRLKMHSNSSEIILSMLPDIKIPEIKYTIPQKGDKLKLLELSERNAGMFLNEKLKLTVLKVDNIKLNKANKLEQMKLDLRLSVVPNYIECFDNSNIQGTNPVAACVVFRNGIPSKNEYRHFNIKTVVGPDDFASMREIIFRRYKRLIDEKENLPDLIVIDGGKGQLSAALESLEKLKISEKVAIIGIAKKLEEIFYPNDPVPLYIDKNSFSLKIIQNLRNEAHRFGITFHRQKRSTDMLKSEFDNILGIGEKTKDALYKKFKSIEAIKLKSIEEIAQIAGLAKAKKIFEYFNKTLK